MESEDPRMLAVRGIRMQGKPLRRPTGLTQRIQNDTAETGMRAAISPTQMDLGL